MAIRLAPSLLIVVSTSLVAANTDGPTVRDMRLFATTGQSAGTYTTILMMDNGSNAGERVSDATLRQRIGLMGIGSLGPIDGAGALLIGVSLNQHQIRTENSRVLFPGQPSSEGIGTATIFGLHVGWGLHLTRGLHAEAVVHVGYGGFTGEETITVTDGVNDFTNRWHSSKNGWYGEAGLTGSLHYTFTSGIQFFVQGSFISGKGENSITERKEGNDVFFITNGAIESEYEIEDVLLSGGIGYRF